MKPPPPPTPAPSQIQVRGRTIHLAPTRFGIYWHDVAAGRWEPETFAILERFVTPDITYVDLGAFSGPTLLFAAQSARSAHGFEPDPAAFAELESNLAKNTALTNVYIHAGAIAPTVGTIRLGNHDFQGNSASSVLLGDLHDSWEVPALRLDEYLAQHEIAGPIFIKMDIEGAEYAVIAAHTALLSSSQVRGIWLSLHPWGHLDAQVGVGQGVLTKLRRRLRHAATHFQLLWHLRNFPHWVCSDGTPLTLSRALLNVLLGRAVAPGNVFLVSRVPYQ